VRRLVTRWVERARALWNRAKREHSTPREIAWSVGIGVFCGCVPWLGLHMWIAMGLATVLRLNRLWAFLGSRVSWTVVYVWIAFVEIEGAHRLRTGAWAPLSPRDALAHGRQLVGDWFLGGAVVGIVLGAILGAAAYGVARRWQAEPRS
jgi:uncharacterized protein (DUF2062 family)